MRNDLNDKILSKEGANLLRKELGSDLIQRITYYIRALYWERPRNLKNSMSNGNRNLMRKTSV